MGTPVDAEPFSENDCNACEAAPVDSPLWADGETPVFIHAYFNDILVCDPEDPVAPGRVICHQDALDPCTWTGVLDDGWLCVIDLTGGGFSAVSLTKNAFECFFGFRPNICKVDFVNTNNCGPPQVIGTGGFCRLVWFTDPIPVALTETYNLMPIDESLYDRLSEAADKRSYRLTHPVGQTNIQIKVDTDDIPP